LADKLFQAQDEDQGQGDGGGVEVEDQVRDPEAEEAQKVGDDGKEQDKVAQEPVSLVGEGRVAAKEWRGRSTSAMHPPCICLFFSGPPLWRGERRGRRLTDPEML
jgi:hypothetical protein